MKKILLFVCSLFMFLDITYANEKIEVIFNGCVDGDTAKVSLNNEQIKIRFLAIDTPETKHLTKKEEPYGKEASNYTCKSLKSANKIEIEYDNDSDKTDKYDRHLVWVFVDQELLQKNLIEKGLAKVAYLYGDYKYTSMLENTQIIAQNQKIGIWSNKHNNYSNIIIVISIVLIIILLIFNQKFRKKMISKFKRKAKSSLKKVFKN